MSFIGTSITHQPYSQCPPGKSIKTLLAFDKCKEKIYFKQNVQDLEVTKPSNTPRNAINLISVNTWMELWWDSQWIKSRTHLISTKAHLALYSTTGHGPSIFLYIYRFTFTTFRCPITNTCLGSVRHLGHHSSVFLLPTTRQTLYASFASSYNYEGTAERPPDIHNSNTNKNRVTLGREWCGLPPPKCGIILCTPTAHHIPQ